MADGRVEIDVELDSSEAESKGAALAGKLAKVGAAAAATMGVATAAIVKQSLDAYASYEQLVGGVDTLFKESSGQLQAYAAEAYKTAGMSANDFMETATSFSASLLQSLGGDTAAAAEYANQAITDMSDNANKMGTSMEMIQNAYQGFAKQNYTMLDNLKLSYGGTKEEMQRLLADASALSGIEYDISSYADVVDAIHVIQTEMGITGTTAREAASTIEGSVASMKAAWSNWLVGLADESADLSALTGQLVDSVITAAGNVLPRMAQIVSSLGAALREQLPVVFAQVLNYLQTAMPSVASAVSGLLANIGSLIATYLPVMMQNAANMWMTFANAIPTVLPALATALAGLATSAISTITGMVPKMFEAAKTLFMSLVSSIAPVLEALIPAVSDMIVSVMEFLPTLFADLLSAAEELFMAVVDSIPTILDALIPAATDLIMRVVELLPTLVPSLLDAAVSLFTSLVDSLPIILPRLLDAALNAIGRVVSMLPTLIPALLSAAATLFLAIAQAVPQVVDSVLSAVGDLLGQIPGKIVGFAEQMATAAKDMVSGMVSGIWDAGGAVWDAITDVCSNALGAIKSFFGINSPSKVMRKMFGYVGDGMALGLSDSESVVNDAMKHLATGASDIAEGFGPELGVALAEGIYAGFEENDPMGQITASVSRGVTQLGIMAQMAAAGGTAYSQTVNFNQPVQSPDEFARAMRMQQRYGLAGAYV